ncbi:MAG: Rpn family recombination-promoting nuclease/putative transposase [Firmicutes bacterium]|nr:Rpn family recombination-promoting nuclease/putative transposase [Bacillota bacterium]
MEDINLMILNDVIFKAMFKTSESFREMLDNIFINYFKISIKEYKLHSEEIPVQNKKDHSNRMDIFLTEETNKKFIDIESNLGSKRYYFDYYMNRNLVYACKLIIWAYNDSEYKEKYSAIQINLNDIENPFDESISSSLMLYDVENKRRDERMTIYNLYLGKIKKLSYNELNELEKDLKMLITNDMEEMETLAHGNTRMMKVMSEYKKLVSNEEFFNILFDPERERELYDRTMKAIAKEEGIEEGLEQGIEQGHNEATIEIAKNMLKLSIPIEQIIEATKLPLEEIEKIKEEM